VISPNWISLIILGLFTVVHTFSPNNEAYSVGGGHSLIVGYYTWAVDPGGIIPIPEKATKSKLWSQLFIDAVGKMPQEADKMQILPSWEHFLNTSYLSLFPGYWGGRGEGGAALLSTTSWQTSFSPNLEGMSRGINYLYLHSSPKCGIFFLYRFHISIYNPPWTSACPLNLTCIDSKMGRKYQKTTFLPTLKGMSRGVILVQSSKTWHFLVVNIQIQHSEVSPAF
jgi:hypothetical protein